MKQFIVTPQLKEELSKDAWFKLVGWGMKRGYLDIRDKISIGQMIDLLNLSRGNLDFYLIVNDAGASVHCGLHGDPHPSPDFERYHIGLEPELCDALWEAVKEVLERE